jgi:hypothetical protein
MAIDLFKTRSQNFDRNKYFSREYIDNMKLIQGAQSGGVFYSTDTIPLKKQTISSGNIKKTFYSLTIETHDVVSTLQVDDFVLYGGDGELYIVESIIFEDDNSMKEFSSRPSYRTEIVLRR